MNTQLLVLLKMVVDVDELMHRVDGNWQLVERLIGRFCSQFEQMTTDIRTSIEEENLKRALELVHKTKGVAANLSCTRLYASSLHLENVLRQKDTLAIPQAMVAFETNLQEVLVLFRQISARHQED